MAHCAHIPAFDFTSGHLSVCDGQTLFGPLSVSLEPSLCGLVGRNGVGKTRLLRLLAGLDSPAGGHIERAAAVAWVAQQPTLTPETTLAALLGYARRYLTPCSALNRVMDWPTISSYWMATGISPIA